MLGWRRMRPSLLGQGGSSSAAAAAAAAAAPPPSPPSAGICEGEWSSGRARMDNAQAPTRARPQPAATARQCSNANSAPRPSLEATEPALEAMPSSAKHRGQRLRAKRRSTSLHAESQPPAAQSWRSAKPTAGAARCRELPKAKAPAAMSGMDAQRKRLGPNLSMRAPPNSFPTAFKAVPAAKAALMAASVRPGPTSARMAGSMEGGMESTNCSLRSGRQSAA
mmetsp:Transcript_17755/g.55976  ORF Transcript_17755/g.55976 Transcript_17755/m.55976 type:complete len:223 (-) Transcript_17755:78-746(-)